MDFLCEESGTSMLLVLFLPRSSGSIVLYKKSLSWRWIPYIWPKQGGAAENAGKVRKHRSIPIHAEGSSPVFAAGRNRGRATSPLLPADAHLQYTAARPAAATSTAVGIRQVRLII